MRGYRYFLLIICLIQFWSCSVARKITGSSENHYEPTQSENYYKYLAYRLGQNSQDISSNDMRSAENSKKSPKNQSSHKNNSSALKASAEESLFLSEQKILDTTFLNELIEEYPEVDFLWHQKALQLADKGDYQGAKQSAQHAIQLDSTNVNAYVLLGLISVAEQKHQEATEYFEKALLVDNSKSALYPMLIRSELILEKKNQAMNHLAECLDVDPQQKDCLYFSATFAYQQGRYQKALDDLKKLEQSIPENPSILIMIAEIQEKTKQYPQAIETYQTLRQIAPEQIQFSFKIAELQYLQKNIEGAIEEFTELRRDYPKSDRVHYFLGMLYNQKNESALAIESFHHVSQESKYFDDALSTAINLERQTNGPESALALFNKMTMNQKLKHSQVLIKSYLLQKLERYSEALMVLKMDESKLSEHERAMLELERAFIYDAQGKWPEAKDTAMRALLKFPNDPYFLNYMGYGMLEKGESPDAALEYLIKAESALPEDSSILDSIGWAYYHKKDYLKALEYLLKANRIKPMQPTICEHLGDVYLALENNEKAKEYFELTLKIIRENRWPDRTQREIQERVLTKRDDL